jgi:hypothetical protein
MAELPLRDRGVTGRLARLRLLVDLERAAKDAEAATRREFIDYMDEQLAMIASALAPDDGDPKMRMN